MPKQPASTQTPIVTATGPWSELLVVCRKCMKKLDGRGFGPDGRDSLTDALKAELRAAGRRRDVRLVSSSCLGICPKGGVTLLRGNAPGLTLVVPKGADLPGLRSHLGLEPADQSACRAASASEAI